MTKDELKLQMLEKRSNLLSVLINAMRCGKDSGFNTIPDLLQFAEKELKKIQNEEDFAIEFELEE